MSDYAHKYTDDELDALEKRITAHYRRVYKELSVKVTNYFEQFEKRDKEQLKALNDGKITELQYQQWRLAQMGRGKRFEAMRDDASKRITKANQIACEYINDRTPDIFAVNRNHLAYGLEKEYGNVGFTIYDENMVKELIAKEKDFLPKPSINVPKDLWWNKKLITAEMTSGILQGESIGKLADRFMNVTDANRVSAIRNARTFVTAAENAGRYDGYKAAEKLGIKGLRKQWLATLDGRTRHSHRELDGQTVEWNEKFKSVLGSEMRYPGDKEGAKAGDLYNCRCTMITVEKSGIVAEDVKRRAGDKLISDMSYKEWENWKKGLESLDKSGIIKETEMFKKHADARKDFTFISDEHFNNLTIEAKKNGATIIRGTPEVEEHLDKRGASASTYGDTILFKKDVCVSEVLEETYHYKQHLNKTNIDKHEEIRILLNEIEAKKYVIENQQKYKVPRNEIELLKKQIKECEEMLERKGETIVKN